MKLLVINPNTSEDMTEDIRRTIEKVKSQDVSVTVTCLDFGPEALESFYDYSLSAFGLCRLLEQEKDAYDGILIGCYGDPGLYAAKEVCKCPVVGIAEASIALSVLIGSRFGILSASEKAVPMMENMVGQYGMKNRLAGVFSLGISVLDAEANPKQSIEALIKQGEKAIQKGAEVLILGCAGMTGFSEPVSEALGVPVIDPVEAGYRMLEMMVKGNIKTSKKGLYKTPDEKNIKNKGLLAEEIY